MNFEFQNVVVQILNFLLLFKLTKGCHQDFSVLSTIILIIHHLFWTKVAHPWCVFTFVANTIQRWGSSKMDWITCKCMQHILILLVITVKYARQFPLMIKVRYLDVQAMDLYSQVLLTCGRKWFVQSRNFKSGMPYNVWKANAKIVVWNSWIFAPWKLIQIILQCYIGNASKKYLL